MERGSFEVEEMEVFRTQLATADVVVDVGANIGLYTCAARLLGKRVVAVEPQPANLRVLYANLTANSFTDVEVMPLGVSDRPGLVTLWGASGTGASLLRGWAAQADKFATVIPVTTLDIITSNRFAGQRLFIKIDIEGAEYLALQGAPDLLKMSPSPTWMTEICLNEYHPSGLNPYYAKTFELFWGHGYEARTADRKGRRVSREEVHRWVSQGKCDSGSINYLWTHCGTN
jgi:FkbM family methyltransferase